MLSRFVLALGIFSISVMGNVPPIEPGVSRELAEWRAARYSDVRYKLNLTLEKMSPVLKGTIEIQVNVSEPPASAGGQSATQTETRSVASVPPIILDWRKIRGHEEKSTISNVTINGRIALFDQPQYVKNGISRYYAEINEHLVFYDNVVLGENVIKLDFTSPILTSGSAITRYIDKEDGSEYIYSLFVPSDASTAFPVFDQPDLKAKFQLNITHPTYWNAVSNTDGYQAFTGKEAERFLDKGNLSLNSIPQQSKTRFLETLPLSTYVFAFAVGDFEVFHEFIESKEKTRFREPRKRFDPRGGSVIRVNPIDPGVQLYVRKSQAAKFKPHAAEVFRLNREAVKYFEEYFDYKFPFPKYDLVLIPEFPFGGMEHAGATFLRESSIIFPQEPTKNDHISRALLIFHEASHQWFGDTVTMRWFDDLWLKEGFATFTAYKAMERIMPEMNAWKVFYERVKQAAYQTDSTKGTTPIYQEIPNLSAAKSAYGAIVYSKAPAFLRQAEFYLGEDNFQMAVRAFLKKHEFGNAGWEDLVTEFEAAAGESLKEDFGKVKDQNLQKWARTWVGQRGLAIFRVVKSQDSSFFILQSSPLGDYGGSHLKFLLGLRFENQNEEIHKVWMFQEEKSALPYMYGGRRSIDLVFPNYQDYGYGIFLLDDKSRDYVLKNIQNEKDLFLRSMMWGALWDSVREGELDPRRYVELVVRVLGKSDAFTRSSVGQPDTVTLTETPKGVTLTEDESTTALLLSRLGTAMNYYIDESRSVVLRPRAEDLLIERMGNAETLGQRITYYRAFLNVASSEKARTVLKNILKLGGVISFVENKASVEPSTKGKTISTDGLSALENDGIPLKTKDKFDIVTRLLILGDPEAPKLLADLEKTETSDDAKRYAYAARAGIATAENKAKYWNDFVDNKDISESWIEAAFVPWNSIRHSELTLPYLERALKELPNHKRDRKIFFVNGWLAAFIGGQRSEEALDIINKFLAGNPDLDNDLRLKILENADIIERAVKIRKKWNH